MFYKQISNAHYSGLINIHKAQIHMHSIAETDVISYKTQENKVMGMYSHFECFCHAHSTERIIVYPG